MTSQGGLLLALELFISMFIIIFHAKKREYFILRLIISIVIVILIGSFFPLPKSLIYNSFYSIFRHLFFMMIIAILFFFMYNLSFKNLIIVSISSSFLQHLAYQIYILLNLNFKGNAYVFEPILLVVIYIIFFFTIGKISKKFQYYNNSYNELNIFLILMFIFNLILGKLPRILNESKYIIYLYDIIYTILALFFGLMFYGLIKSRVKSQMMKYELAKVKEQYRFKKETIDAIHIKFHDLKLLLYKNENVNLDEIKELVHKFDLSVCTKNQTLDTIITDYILRYDKDKVVYNFYGDASSLNILELEDLIILFKNILDNATEASLKMEENKGIININIESKGDLIHLCIYNYYKNLLKNEDGEFITSKTNDVMYHGFGIKSIIKTVNKYNGKIKIETVDNVFKMNIFFIK